MRSPDVVPPPAEVPEPLIDSIEALFGAPHHPRLHALDDGPGSQVAGDALRVVLAALERYRPGGPSLVLSLDGVLGDALVRLFDVLGEGDVKIAVQGAHPYDARETALPGVWRVQRRGADGALEEELLEVADVPAVVRAASREAPRSALEIGRPPEGAMNVLPLLAELRHRMATWRPGDPNHVVSFSLLPMTPADMRFAQAQLRRGPVQAESKGYGACRVELTGHRHVWSVQYLNAMGGLVLDTLEVGDVPAALRAGAEDFEDSAARLAELLGV